MSRLAPLHALAPLLLWTPLVFHPDVNGFALSAAFALLVATPLALRVDRDTPAWLRAVALFAGVLASLAFILPAAPATGCLAATWCAFVMPNFVYGLVRFLNAGNRRDPVVWAEAASVVGPVVGASALVASRGGHDFLGFPEPLPTLTVTHFHFTFGLLPLTLAALTRRLRETRPDAFTRRLADGGLWGVVFAPPLVGLCFLLRGEKLIPGYAEVAATAALALAVATWAHAAFWKLAPRLDAADAWTVRLSSVALTFGTGLGAWFAYRLSNGDIPLTYHDMLRWHGVTNALATVALALVALRVSGFHGMLADTPPPDTDAPITDLPPERALFRDDRVFDLGPDTPGRFDALREALLAYRFYPETVMRSTSPFKTEGRPARIGDRIGMALAVPIFPGLPPARFAATTQVNLVIDTPECAALGYVTTGRHYGRGAWSAELTRADGRLRLRIRSHMTPSHPLSRIGLPFYRFLQKRAHRLGAQNLGATSH